MLVPITIDFFLFAHEPYLLTSLCDLLSIRFLCSHAILSISKQPLQRAIWITEVPPDVDVVAFVRSSTVVGLKTLSRSLKASVFPDSAASQKRFGELEIMFVCSSGLKSKVKMKYFRPDLQHCCFYGKVRDMRHCPLFREVYSFELTQQAK